MSMCKHVSMSVCWSVCVAHLNRALTGVSLCPFEVHVISLVLLVSALAHVALIAPGP